MFSKTKLLSFIFILLFIFSSSALCVPAKAQDAPDEEQNLVAAARQMRQSNNVQLNFNNLEIGKFLRFMSELLNENIVVDPAVGGKVSVVSPKAISLKEAREVMLSVLEMNNLSIQNMGGYSKVVPAASGPTVNNTVIKGDRSITPGEALTVQMVPLRHVKARYITEPLKSAVPDVNVTPLEKGMCPAYRQVRPEPSVSVIRALDAKDSVRNIKAFTYPCCPKTVESQLNVMSKDTSSRLGILAVGDEDEAYRHYRNDQALLESGKGPEGARRTFTRGKLPCVRLKNADAK